MFPNEDIPTPGRGLVQVYPAVESIDHAERGGQYWEMWHKPPGISIASFLLVGGGGGGGGGRTNSAGANKGGAGAGSTGSISRLVVPAICLPDRMRIYCGEAGAGGAANAAGGTGGVSYVLVGQSFGGNYDYLLRSPGGNGGAAGSNAGSNVAGGASPSAGVITDNWGATLGVYISNVGQAGANGSGTGAGSSNSFINAVFIGGGGGAGSGAGDNSAAGGAILAAGPHPGRAGGAAAMDGLPGLSTWEIKDRSTGIGSLRNVLMACGGTGGGSNGSGLGGRGGRGWHGCGGGGGGGGITGGPGGDGGRGLCIIACA